MSAINNYKQDYLLAELPPSVKNNLEKANTYWLNSYHYCTGFAKQHAPERLFRHTNASQTIEPIYYRLTRSMGFIKIIDIIGFPNSNDEAIKQLIKQHKAHFATVDRIENAVEEGAIWKPLKSHIYLKSYMTIAPLPTTQEAYLQQLGKNKRRQLPRYLRCIHKHFGEEGTFSYQKQAEIDIKEVLELEALNRERRGTKGKGLDSLWQTQNWLESLEPLIKQSGFMLCLRKNGEIIGGNLSFIYNDTAYMLITGHNPNDDYLRIGNVCIWKTMDYLIDQNIGYCNFLWGRKPYKTQFLGVEYPMSVHIISSNKIFSTLWCYKIAATAFLLRLIRFVKTKMNQVN